MKFHLGCFVNTGPGEEYILCTISLQSLTWQEELHVDSPCKSSVFHVSVLFQKSFAHSSVDLVSDIQTEGYRFEPIGIF